jgi:hypothetical protein
MRVNSLSRTGQSSLPVREHGVRAGFDAHRFDREGPRGFPPDDAEYDAPASSAIGIQLP